MLPKLSPPTVIPTKEVSDFIWSLPKGFAPKLVDLLWHEARIVARCTEIDSEECMVSATYPHTKDNFVIFACLIFTEFYNDCKALQGSYDTEELVT